MIVILQIRNGDIHVADYVGIGGTKITICAKTYRYTDIMNIFSADLSINGICSTCHTTYQQMYQDDLDFHPRRAKGSLYDDLIDNYNFIQLKLSDTKSKFHKLNNRISFKINKYHKNVSFLNKRKRP